MDLKIPVAKILDFWGTGMPREKGFSPDRLCVLDEPSRAYEARMRNMLPEHIIATGAPQFDTLLNVRTLPRGVMAKYGVEKEKPFMLFVAPSSETRVREVLNLLFQVLSDVTHPIVLGTLWHPRMEKTDKWSAWLRDQLYCLSHVTHIDDEVLRKIGSTDELLATANVVVGSTSTELVKACYLRRPVVSILPQGGINHSEVLLARDIHELPTSACGASLHTENFSQLFDCYFDFREGGVRWVRRSQAMLEAQKANYRLDGKNTKRAVSVVESFF